MGVACFWATSFGKNIGGVIALISFRLTWDGYSSLLPFGGVLSFRSEAREVLGSETTRVHHAAQRRGTRMAARGARAAARADAAHRRIDELDRRRSGNIGPRHSVRAGAAAIGLDRWPQRANRLPLERGRCRPLSQIRGRIGCACTGRNPSQ